MQKKITKRSVDELHAAANDVILWDTAIRGFGVRCRPSGAKYYTLKMRVGGRQRWMTIGQHGSPWTPDSARAKALSILGLKADGEDPAAERDRKKGVATVGELGVRFLEEYVPNRCKPRTAQDYGRAVNQHINRVIGHHPVTDVTRADVNRLHHQMRERPYQANHALAVLSKMMNLAEQWGLRPDGSNPCKHVKKYKETKRERYLTREELQRLGTTLAEAQANHTENPFVLAAIGLLILTGARLTEILTLQWTYVDLENGILRLPDSKTGPKLIQLNAAAISLLRSLPRMQNNPFVIVGQKPGARLINLQKRWQRIRAKAGLNDLRIHDLRHSFASVAAGVGLSLPMIGKLLGHSQPSTTARYAHLAADPVRAASDLIGSEIMAVMSPVKPQKRPRVRLHEPT